MIRAEFNIKGGVISLYMTGHAGSGEKGYDIVCSAASMLAYTAAQTLQFMYAEGVLEEKPLTMIQEGEAQIECRPKKESFSEALHTFYVVQVGFYLLARNFPQYAELIPFEEPNAACQ